MTSSSAVSRTPEKGPGDGWQATYYQRMLAQFGGVWGVVYSSLPVMVFVLTSHVFGLLPAIGSALGVAVLVLVWRLILGQSTRPAVSGFLGVAFCALIAYALGKSKDYFLLGIWTSLLWAVVFGLSIVIRRPMVGYLWSWAGGHGRHWSDVRRAVYAFDLATLAWMVVFLARFVVQRHLYDTDQIGVLGIARIAMGWPLTAVAAVLIYLTIKAAQRAMAGGGTRVLDRTDPGCAIDYD